MSIASEISALTTDRNNIRAALVAKGIAAASASGFDSFAGLITSIPTGSGPVPSGSLNIDIYDPDPPQVPGIPYSIDPDSGEWSLDWVTGFDLYSILSAGYRYLTFSNGPLECPSCDECENWYEQGYGNYEDCRCSKYGEDCPGDPCVSREECENLGGNWDDETGCDLCQEEPEE